jgi:CheY-like chemotaxis protein
MSDNPAPCPGAPGDTVLVADDDPVAREILRHMLDAFGFAVTTAVDGRDALRRFRYAPTRLVVTDILMPEMDGIELIKALRAEPAPPRIIAVSADGDWPKYCEIATDFGAKALLQKPVSPADLMDAVRRVLSSEGRRDRAR